MSDIQLVDADLRAFLAVAEVLVPGTNITPAPSALRTFEGLVRTAVQACGYTATAIRGAIDALPDEVDFESMRQFCESRPADFHIVSELVSAAYFMAPEAMAAIGYPVQRRHPPGLEEFADEFESGLLDQILEMGPRFRETR